MILSGYGIGELTVIIVMFVMFIGGEMVQCYELFRIVVGCFYGLVVLIGLVWGLGQVSYVHDYLSLFFCFGNVLNFVVVGVMLLFFFSE